MAENKYFAPVFFKNEVVGLNLLEVSTFMMLISVHGL